MGEIIKHGFQKVDLVTSSGQSLISDSKGALSVTIVDDAIQQRYSTVITQSVTTAGVLTSSVYDIRNYSKAVLQTNVAGTVSIQVQQSLDNVNWLSSTALITANGFFTLTGYSYLRTINSIAAGGMIYTYLVAGN